MVKSYLRYALDDVFGTINSSNCASVALISDYLVATGTDEIVTIWNCRSGDVKLRLKCKSDGEDSTASAVSCFHYSIKKEKWMYVGYANGSIRGFQIQGSFDTFHAENVFEEFYRHGHKGEVTCLTTRYFINSCIYFSESGQLLASGSRDCHIVIWDVLGDSGLFRLEGHKNEITAMSFLRPIPSSEHNGVKYRRLATNGIPFSKGDDILGFFISCSKDCMVRIWDLTTQSCIQTIISFTDELYGLAINKSQVCLFL
ncbi:bifunctional G-protein beta WD-40 repeat/WD40 repeat/WD40-YVTN repeat-like-containing domain superfamily/WD40 repeat [Babesia duncani]|uniref:Bifunctional G-protein beta WD-40 repeat/WD40 repeat/WD40-YVTN repeat-like-containing domain superfamily/WD40 repeat n=1 Tax=Babesia duncani TaxID=323732 RepID=A0AAD9PI29_9APIC|nr:bifunctional G-protein beta WD-40 repeat/WD40 repeat/WD40-YVTN repeat-like-containing domain superfamily/WD40 repeat [Babesia duncani]